MRTNFLEAQTVARIAQSLVGTVRVVWLLMNDTGLRVSDAIKVKYGDIDEKGNIHYLSTKTKKEGICAVSGNILCLLGKGRAEEYVFKSTKFPNKHIHRSTVFKAIKKACIRCGIDPDGVGCHSARKSFAVRDFRENGLGKTMHHLQHSNPATTLFYALSDDPIPRIFADLKIIKQNLDFHYGLIEELRETLDGIFERIVDIDSPLDVKLTDEKRGENPPSKSP